MARGKSHNPSERPYFSRLGSSAWCHVRRYGIYWLRGYHGGLDEPSFEIKHILEAYSSLCAFSNAHCLLLHIINEAAAQTLLLSRFLMKHSHRVCPWAAPGQILRIVLLCTDIKLLTDLGLTLGIPKQDNRPMHDIKETLLVEQRLIMRVIMMPLYMYTVVMILSISASTKRWGNFVV